MRKPYDFGRAWIELDTVSLQHNVVAIRSLLPPECELMPDLSANASGHGAVLMADALSKMGVTAFCVASVSEAIELRENGIKGEILILGYTHPVDFLLLAQYDLTQTVISFDYAVLLETFGQNTKVQLAIDTGMHSTGVPVDEYRNIKTILDFKNLMVSGMFTQLCITNYLVKKDIEFAENQNGRFQKLNERLTADGYSLKTYVVSSYGLRKDSSPKGDCAQIGIPLFGAVNRRRDLALLPIELKPVLSLKARVISIKDIKTGDYVGYDCAYKANRTRRIATLGIGYGDGVPRSLSCGHGKVLIRGEAAPVVGYICRNQMMVDVSDIPHVHHADPAVLIGCSGETRISIYDLAEQANMITDEILSGFGTLLCRVMI